MVSEKELLARVKEESKTAKEYAREGYLPQARDEARHAKFFKQQALMKGKGWHGESAYHSLARMTGASGKPTYANHRELMHGGVTYLHTIIPDRTITPKKLGTVKMGRKTYFIDERLGELRNVKNPYDAMPLDKDMEEAIAYSKIIKAFKKKRGYL